MTITDATTVTVVHDIDAPVARAFHVFTAEIGTWWDDDKHLLSAPLAEMVFEPFVGGNIIDRGTDGSECRWARVLAYEPPHRVVFSWDIATNWQLEPDAERTSEVEILFTELDPTHTRVQLTHRHLDRHGPGWESMRDAVGSGWSLAGFADRVAAGNRAAGRELPIVDDASVQQWLAATRTYTVVRLVVADPEAWVDSIVREHGRRNLALSRAGLLPVVLPVRDDSAVAGFGVFAADPEQVRAIMADDPAVRAGIFSYEVHPVAGVPGSALG